MDKITQQSSYFVRRKIFLYIRTIANEIRSGNETETPLNDYSIKRYGIKFHVDNDGNYNGDYDIVNEQLYTLFLLKFGD